ncbi:DNA-directed RNA polymerase I subunit RPA34.5-domain-containing protein [Macrophomina phaseolina]|uniref:DNA-directed RNA polymerase I subunit RPA34.5-domain-containing protein n=1 Tax=Macrophomina phaseolina TaxID=35725 RepID=A0ABQ8FYP5_9PEZI|nr:DNA-directed RNA polymerase I subunit RPA34.5-domain-containing protein [Macrophomina phaseolina]
MSAVKRTPIPLPGKAAAATNTPSKPPKPASKPIPQDDESSSEESSDESSSGSDNAHIAAKTNGTSKPEVKKAATAQPASSSEASDSSEEEEDDEEEEGEEGGESSDEAEQAEQRAAPKKTETAKATATRKEASESGSGSEESESESESEEDTAPKSAQTASSAKLQATQFRTSTFQPPSGFKSAKPGLSSSSNLAQLLHSTDLSQKQIWHITAPADIDIKQIKQFVRGSLKKPAIEHKGVGYAFIPGEKSTRAAAKLLIPTEKGYSAVPAEISETLHLQQIVNIPKLSAKKADSAHTTGATQKFVERPEKPARPQPEGLRMRFKPYGYSGDMTGTIGFDNEVAASAPKRKYGDAPAETTSPKKSRKDKKHKEKSRKEDAEAGEPMEGVELTVTKDAEESEKKKKKKDKDKEGKKEKKEKKRKE